ncbi:hypothetical protein J7J62_07810 [bacterium]|nr:hypothetical protein [bacterium]
MNNLYQKILDEEIVKPQLKKQVGWINDFILQSPWNKKLTYFNSGLDFYERPINEEEDI